MTWHDFLVDRKLGHEDVALGIAFMFGVDVSRVVVSEDITEAEAAQVNCVLHHIDGEFQTVVEVYVDDKRLECLPALPTIAKFAEKLGCTCLVSDDSPNPYSWMLVDSAGRARQVFLDS